MNNTTRIMTVAIPGVLLSLFLFAGCSSDKKPPGDLIEEDTYIDLLADMQLAKSYLETLPRDSVSRDSLHREIFDFHEVSKEQFDRSHAYYQRQVGEQHERIMEAIDRLRMQPEGPQGEGDSTAADSTQPTRSDSLQ